MQRDGTGQRGEEQDEVEQGGNDGSQRASCSECLLEDVGQRNEGQAGTHAGLIRIHADVEYGREDDESCHNGYCGVDSGYVDGRLGERCLLVEVAGIGA